MIKTILKKTTTIFICLWALLIVVIQILLYGPYEFALVLNLFIPKILQIKFLLDPWLTANYKG